MPRREYSLCAEPLRIVCPFPSRLAILAGTLESLFSLVPLNRQDPEAIEFLIDNRPAPETPGELVFDAPGLAALRTEHGYHLQSRDSFLALDLRTGQATGSLSDPFLHSPPEDQRGIFLFAFMLLLSARGLYGLHAAAALWKGCGFLLVGGSGSGKTTLACALTRSGWQYLSDDSTLLKQTPSGLEALALGRLFHCDPALFRHFPELAGCHPNPASSKRLVDVSDIYPGQYRLAMHPRIVLFPEIAAQPHSRLEPLTSTETLVGLLGEGVGFLRDRASMAGQLQILGDLARSAQGFRLLHGEDVHSHPARVAALLRELAEARIKGDDNHALSSAA